MLFNTHPLLSIFFSLLIINGFYNLSRIISANKTLKFFNNYAVQGGIIVFFFLINFVSIFFYIYFLFFGVNKFLLQGLIILLILIGFYKPVHFKSFLKIIKIIDNKLKFLLLLFIDKKVIASFLRVVKAQHKRWIWLCRGLLLIRLVWFFMLLLLSLLDSISFIDDVKLPP